MTSLSLLLRVSSGCSQGEGGLCSHFGDLPGEEPTSELTRLAESSSLWVRTKGRGFLQDVSGPGTPLSFLPRGLPAQSVKRPD